MRELIQGVGRTLVFDDLPVEELRSVVGRFFRGSVERGESLFQRGQLADRMYLMEDGEVALADPQNELRPTEKLHEGDEAGALAFVTGARHTDSAVATTDTRYWVPRQRDFDALLRESPLLQEKVAVYLKQRHEFNADDAARWVHGAVHNMAAGRPLRSVADFAEKIKEHKGASVAIWLGIMLDGIPESIVIDSSMLHSGLSLSLLAGVSRKMAQTRAVTLIQRFGSALNLNVRLFVSGLQDRVEARVGVSSGIGARIDPGTDRYLARRRGRTGVIADRHRGARRYRRTAQLRNRGRDRPDR